MTNRRLISLVTGVLIFAVLLPVALSIWLAHRQAEESFMNELDTFSQLVKMRVERVVNQGKTALRQLDNFKGAPCSSEHLLMMRQISYSYRYVQEVLYLDNSRPLCSSMERDSTASTFPAPQTVGPEGFKAWIINAETPGFKRNMVALGSQHHVVITDPLSFIDVLSFGPWPINIALIGRNTGQVVATTHPLEPAMVKEIINSKTQQFHARDAAWHVSQVPELSVTIVTWAALTPLQQNWHHLLMIWLPLGLLLSLLIAFFLLRILRRLQSPHQRMLDAIRSREIVVFYQPIVALESGKAVGAEALARWRQSDGTLLAPDVFIPLAEQTGLMPQLTRLIIENVFSDMGAWLQANPEMHISINIDPTDLLNRNLPVLLRQHIHQWQLSPAQIALELTERGFADPKMSVPVIAALRAEGHAIYIDDFGTGYSSLSYLQDLEVDILKIDKSFVDAVEYKNVTPHIIEMAKALNLAMVAEGIETEGQLRWLQEHGVQFGQGWYYSKALAKEEFIAWTQRNLRAHGID